MVDSESGDVIGVLQAINKHPEQTMLKMRVYSQKRAGTKMFSSANGKNRSGTVLRKPESKRRTTAGNGLRSPSMINAILGDRMSIGSASRRNTILEGEESESESEAEDETESSIDMSDTKVSDLKRANARINYELTSFTFPPFLADWR